MKSFQKRGRGFRTLQSKNCTHGRSSIIYIKNAASQNQNAASNQKQNENQKGRYTSQSPQQERDDPHSTMIKSLVAMNQEYFHSKLQVPNDGKPRQLKLKIPSKTGFTIYKRDYIKNQQNIAHKISKFKQNKIDGIFLGNTTYRNQYLGKQNGDKAERVQRHKSVDPTAPRFLQTQYKHNFQNWGAENKMPSMKPEHITAQSLPFQAVSMYSSQFTNKPHPKQEDGRLSASATFSANNNIISSQVTSPLLYMTTSNAFFDRKNFSKENNLKPKNQNSLGGLFKGKTQYQSQFVKSKNLGAFSPSKKKPLVQLQNLILKL